MLATVNPADSWFLLKKASGIWILSKIDFCEKGFLHWQTYSVKYREVEKHFFAKTDERNGFNMCVTLSRLSEPLSPL